MRKVALISAASALLGYAAVYLAFFGKPAPEPETPVAQAPAEPVVLADVVEVTDTEPLLDARPKETAAAGVPFDPQVVPASFTAPAAVPPIPAAVDDPVADPGRVMWYGGHRLPKQIGGGLPPEVLAREVYELLRRPSNLYVPSGVNCGVGYYF